MTIAWAPSLSVGVARFDDQHRCFIGLINQLSSAVAAGEGPMLVDDILLRLVDYTHTHFKDEEVAMFETHYPKYREHKALHGAFANEVQVLMATRGASSSVPVELVEVMSRWLLQHIRNADQQYASHLREYGY